MRADIQVLVTSGLNLKAKRNAKPAQPADGRSIGMQRSLTLFRSFPMFWRHIHQSACDRHRLDEAGHRV